MTRRKENNAQKSGKARRVDIACQPGLPEPIRVNDLTIAVGRKKVYSTGPYGFLIKPVYIISAPGKKHPKSFWVNPKGKNLYLG